MDKVDPHNIGSPVVFLPGEPHTFDNQIVYACRTMIKTTDPLCPLIVKAIIAHESGFAEGIRGDYYEHIGVKRALCPPYRGVAFTEGFASLGLMQVNRVAHPHLAVVYNLLDPNENILAGVEILAGAYLTHWPDWPTMIRAYNGQGPATEDYFMQVAEKLAPWIVGRIYLSLPETIITGR